MGKAGLPFMVDRLRDDAIPRSVPGSLPVLFFGDLLRAIDRPQADAVLERDLGFLRRQIEHFQLRAVICTSAQVVKSTCRMLDATDVARGTLSRIIWQVGIAETKRCVVGVAG